MIKYENLTGVNAPFRREVERNFPAVLQKGWTDSGAGRTGVENLQYGSDCCHQSDQRILIYVRNQR